jgi:hypothetical protein
MKNALKISLLVLLLNTGSMMQAAEDLDIKVLDSQNLRVELNGGSQGNILLIKDKFGKVLFRDSITTNLTYQKTFNMELVPNGIYYMNLDNESRIQTTVIVKTNSGLDIEKESSFVSKPRFEIKDKQIRVLWTNSLEKKTVMNIYDSSGILVANLDSKELVLKKTLDFSNVPSGKYRIEIEVNGQNFTKEVYL